MCGVWELIFRTTHESVELGKFLISREFVRLVSMWLLSLAQKRFCRCVSCTSLKTALATAPVGISSTFSWLIPPKRSWLFLLIGPIGDIQDWPSSYTSSDPKEMKTAILRLKANKETEEWLDWVERSTMTQYFKISVCGCRNRRMWLQTLFDVLPSQDRVHLQKF